MTCQDVLYIADNVLTTRLRWFANLHISLFRTCTGKLLFAVRQKVFSVEQEQIDNAYGYA